MNVLPYTGAHSFCFPPLCMLSGFKYQTDIFLTKGDGPAPCAGLPNNDNCNGYKAESITMSLKEMAQHYVLVCQIMTTAIDTMPKARLCY